MQPATFPWTDPVTRQRREIAVPKTREDAVSLVAHVPEPDRTQLLAAYDEGWFLKRTRLDALWYMNERNTELRMAKAEALKRKVEEIKRRGQRGSTPPGH